MGSLTIKKEAGNVTAEAQSYRGHKPRNADSSWKLGKAMKHSPLEPLEEISPIDTLTLAQ